MKKEIKEEVMRYLVKHQATDKHLEEICNTVLDKVRKDMIKNPKPYLTKTTDKHGNSYLHAKVFWPTSLLETKELKIHVGKMTDFPDGAKDRRAYEESKRIMKERLRRELTA